MRRAAAIVSLLVTGAAWAGPLPPTRAAALRRWLDAGVWRATWVAEPAPHASAGAHASPVRTWYSPVLVDDLAARRSAFRKGASMVKELIGDDGLPRGFAVMRKVRARSGADGRGWYFYEAIGGRPIAGRAVPICAGCHARGQDFLLSTFRP